MIPTQRWANLTAWLERCSNVELALILWAIADEVRNRNIDEECHVRKAAWIIAGEQDLHAAWLRYVGPPSQT